MFSWRESIVSLLHLTKNQILIVLSQLGTVASRHWCTADILKIRVVRSGGTASVAYTQGNYRVACHSARLPPNECL